MNLITKLDLIVFIAYNHIKGGGKMIEIEHRTTVTHTYKIGMELTPRLYSALKRLSTTPCKCTASYHCSQTGQMVEAEEPKECKELRAGLKKLGEKALEEVNLAKKPRFSI